MQHEHMKHRIFFIEDVSNGGMVGIIPGIAGAIIVGKTEDEIKAKAPEIVRRIQIRQAAQRFNHGSSSENKIIDIQGLYGSSFRVSPGEVSLCM